MLLLFRCKPLTKDKKGELRNDTKTGFPRLGAKTRRWAV